MTKFPKTALPFIWQFFTRYSLYFLIMILINILAAGFITVQPYVLKQLIDAATPLIGHPDFISATILPASLLILLTILNNVVWRWNNYVTLKAMPSLKADILEGASDYVHYHSFKFFQDNLSGAVSNRIVDLANNMDNLIISLRALFQQFIVILSAILIAAVVNPLFSIIFFVWTILFLLFGFYCSKTIEPYAKSFAEIRSLAIGNIVDSFANAINVILFSREDYEKSYLRTSLNEMVLRDTIFQKKLMKLAFIMSSMTILVQAFAILPLLYLGHKGLLTVGDFALIFLLSHSVLENIWSFTEGLFKVAEQRGIFNQAIQFISQKHDIVDSKKAVPLVVDSGNIVFSRVNFSYNESQKLFLDKTLVIQGGEKVGLVGFSGSGKTSFVNLITRTFDIQKGDILIDNQSIRAITLKSLRDNIAFIPQDPTLFHRSLMDNIRYGKLEASDEEVIEAAKKANVHEFAMALENGYQTLVGERGVKLSGGQRQRIAIARAILKDAPILILDEATSALDSATEALIQEALKLAMKNKTVIVIAHRLSTIKAMDRIIVFDNGRVVEEGPHELLLMKAVIYPKLWKMQQGYLSDLSRS